jgi:hypothetical protein
MKIAEWGAKQHPPDEGQYGVAKPAMSRGHGFGLNFTPSQRDPIARALPCRNS